MGKGRRQEYLCVNEGNLNFVNFLLYVENIFTL